MNKLEKLLKLLPFLEGKRLAFLDIEANGLMDATKVWCIVIKDLRTGAVTKFRPIGPLTGHDDFGEAFKEYSKNYDVFIGHNIIGYDYRVLNNLLKMDIGAVQLLDTLVLSRLFRPVSPPGLQPIKTDNRIGGHSLEAWGKRLGFHKGEYNDWSQFNEAMLEYCVQDVELLERIFWYLVEHEMAGFSELSIRLEHRVADLLREQELNGFYLDKTEATKLRDATRAVLDEMDGSFQHIFPPVKKIVRTWTAKRTLNGELGKVSQRILDQHGELAVPTGNPDEYHLMQLQEFNPQSSIQIAERLLALGWNPKKFTDKGRPATDKLSLASAIEELSQYPEVKALSEYNIVADRNQKAQKWLDLVQEDGCVHGRINPIGAGTHRCSHFDDNMANIARVVPGTAKLSDFRDFDTGIVPYTLFDNDTKVFVKQKGEEVEFLHTGLKGAFGFESRNCWTPPPGMIQVGADASGIQLRALAHYMEDSQYIKEVISGDIHTVNQIAAGIATRNKAKTFIYAWLLGAGDEKIGTIVGVEESEYDELYDWVGGEKGVRRVINKLRKAGRKADKRTCFVIIKGAKVKKQFLDATPPLKRLKEEDIPAAAAAGYLVGIDGRKLWIPSEHLAMSLYLQGFEAVIMKMAMALYSSELKKQGVVFKQMAFVHDEFQIATLPETADLVGQTVVSSIQKAGEMLGSKCPLDGEYKLGMSWAQCH